VTGSAVLPSGARTALVLVFGLAAVEKVITLRSGSAAWHPGIIVSNWRRTHAVSLLSVALAADIACIGLLSWRPLLGSAASMVGLAGYTALAPRHLTGDRCHCFWRILDSRTFGTLVVRNALLVGMAVLVFLQPPDWSIGAVLASLPFILGLSVLVTSLDRQNLRDPRHRDWARDTSGAQQTRSMMLTHMETGDE